MNLRPIIARELRTSARRGTTYYSRLVPGLVLLIVAWFGDTGLAGNAAMVQLSANLFNVLHATLFSLIWLLVPLITADIISREKREDTLGLLLLTPLRAHEVVVAKAVNALISGAMLILASVPIIAIPIMFGGVTGGDLMRSCLINCSALIGAVTAGLLASSVSEKRGRAWAVCLLMAGGCFSIIYSAMVMVEISFAYWGQNRLAEVFDWLIGNPGYLFALPVAGWVFAAGLDDTMLGISNSGLGRVIPAIIAAAGSFLFAWIGIRFAAARVRGHFDARFLTVRQQKVRSFFTRERFFAKGLNVRRAGLLERNPSAWLAGRKWSARLTKWGWLFLSVSVVTISTLDGEYYFGETVATTCVWLGMFMLASVTLISVTSLPGERDSGAFELLLVTHLDPRRFVAGRLQGIQCSFIPSALLVASVYSYTTLFPISWNFANMYSPDHVFEEGMLMAAAVMFFFTLLRYLPVIGLCFSLGRPGLLASCLNTLFFAVIVPWLFPLFAMGLGVIGFAMWEGTVSDTVPEKRALFVTVTLLAGLQAAIFVVKKRGKLADFPNIWPRWFVRYKIGWLAPWIAPMAMFLFFFAAGGAEWLRHVYAAKWVAFILWHVAAWTLLIIIATGCRRALIGMLEKRTFLAT